MKILILDRNHPSLVEKLRNLDYFVEEDYTSEPSQIQQKIKDVDGLILRSRLKVDEQLLKHASKLKCIVRVGSGLENINTSLAKQMDVEVHNTPEGNAPAVGEHALGMLLCLMHKIHSAAQSVRNKHWNRNFIGDELNGKNLVIIGYGNTGRDFAKKLSGFNELNVYFHDILPFEADAHAQPTDYETIFTLADILSLHLPETPQTIGYINENFIEKMQKPFYLLNTSRGKCVKTQAVLYGLKKGKILGFAADVMEDETSDFKVNFQTNYWDELLQHPQVLITPHIAGKSIQSEERLADLAVEKMHQTLSKFK